VQDQEALIQRLTEIIKKSNLAGELQQLEQLMQAAGVMDS
jgi:hypothetical protein